jgi:hypothetical protein
MIIYFMFIYLFYFTDFAIEHNTYTLYYIKLITK